MTGVQTCALPTELPGLEARLRAEQKLLAAEGRASGRVDAKYLEMPPSQLLSAMINHPDRSPAFEGWRLALDLCRALGRAASAAEGHPFVEADPLRPQNDAALDKKKRKQRVAFILERRAVQALIAALERLGLAPSITINDQVLFAGEVVDASALADELARSVSDEHQFRAGVKLTPPPFP